VHVEYIASTSDLVFWEANFRCFTQTSKENWIQKLAGKIHFPAKKLSTFMQNKKALHHTFC
jgi:hypothetical protein